MLRKEFLQLLSGGIAGMTSLNDLRQATSDLAQRDNRMPVLFMGHGSPMNGIQENEFNQYWVELAREIPRPEAVLCVSAHWLTKGTHVTAMSNPKTIHDFGGFPESLYEVEYPAPGSPAVAKEISALVESTNVGLNHDWGLDHGTWTVVRHMYPDANIPVLQLSIDYNRPPEYHYKLAAELAALRKKGVLIIGSGNMVHNLRRIDWQNMDTPDYGYDWAKEMNTVFKQKIEMGDHKTLLNYQSLGSAAKLAVPTPDHFYPLIYTLGLQHAKDDVEFFNDKCVAGSLTMTSVKFSH